MARNVCTIEGCGKFAEGRGWCSKHYTRWKRYGSPTARMPGEIVAGCRVCPGCQIDKPVTDYSAATGRCRPCVAERMRQRRLVRPDPGRPTFEAICANCAAVFMGDKRRWRYCSTACSDARKWKDNYVNVERRRIKERGVTVERFLREEIFERDGWTCQLCAAPIDPNLRHPDIRSASVDHIVPISKGGAHSRANVQATHLTCNLSKGARILTDGVA